jgi:hypothetical protein
MFHLGFRFEPSQAKQGRIERALNGISIDWLRYSPYGWIVYAISADRIHIAVREAIDRGDQFLVLPLDTNSPPQGLVPGWVWDWLTIDRTLPNWQSKVSEIRASLVAPPPFPSQTSSLGDLLRALQAPKS